MSSRNNNDAAIAAALEAARRRPPTPDDVPGLVPLVKLLDEHATKPPEAQAELEGRVLMENAVAVTGSLNAMRLYLEGWSVVARDALPINDQNGLRLEQVLHFQRATTVGALIAEAKSKTDAIKAKIREATLGIPSPLLDAVGKPAA